METRAAERLQERAANHSPFTQRICRDVGVDPMVVEMISPPVMFRTEDDLISAISCVRSAFVVSAGLGSICW